MEAPRTPAPSRFASAFRAWGALLAVVLLLGCPDGSSGSRSGGANPDDTGDGTGASAAAQCQCEPAPTTQSGTCVGVGDEGSYDEDDGAAGSTAPDDTEASAGTGAAGAGATGGAAAPDLSAITNLIGGGGASSAVRSDPSPVLCPSSFECQDLMGFPVCKKEALPPSCTTNADCAKAGLPNVPCVDLSSAVGFPIVACLQLCNSK